MWDRFLKDLLVYVFVFAFGGRTTESIQSMFVSCTHSVSSETRPLDSGQAFVLNVGKVPRSSRAKITLQCHSNLKDSIRIEVNVICAVHQLKMVHRYVRNVPEG
ncbi:hypothetical protein EV702DRAFT_173022 [Suillus placidus]|uniref:Secreted protein n=1 Tax=Suillus placidus TaxID=48579 RepID=A0A9P6ZXA7_9AGAM|nr:hypothetical protein EV702DRAFT_173022 [Suillus placidus]